jgi:hypothetical protein
MVVVDYWVVWARPTVYYSTAWSGAILFGHGTSVTNAPRTNRISEWNKMKSGLSTSKQL